jgi:glycosyltransferase involved in cell wall biosynthesis
MAHSHVKEEGATLLDASRTAQRLIVASVVIPTRNRCDKLQLCLDRLQLQTQRNFEILVVDDGSADHTPQMLSAFLPARPDVLFRSFRNPQPRGANPSRNLSIRESQGDFVAFLDDDCVPDADWLERLLEGFVDEDVAAVTGLVEDAPARNLFELTVKGAHRVHGKVEATRLVCGNMCVRRRILVSRLLDENRATAAADMSVSGRGDEEGLYLALKAEGFKQRVVHAARVVHDHPQSARSFFKQAFRSGISAARLGYQYRLPPRVELVPLLLGYLLLPACLLQGPGWLLPVGCFAVFLAAILYNEYWRKRKSLWEIFITFPLLLASYHVRLAGYVIEFVRIRLRPGNVSRVAHATAGSFRTRGEHRGK